MDEPDGVAMTSKPDVALEAIPAALAVADPDWCNRLRRCKSRIGDLLSASDTLLHAYTLVMLMLCM